MTLAAPLIHKADVAALNANPAKAALQALGVVFPAGITVNPAQGQGLPYVVVGSDTESQEAGAKDGVATDVTHTLTVYAETQGRAKDIASAVVTGLMSRRTLAGTPYVLAATLDAYGPPVRQSGTTAWGVLLRLRYSTEQPR